MHSTPFQSASLLDRASAMLAAFVITFSLLGAVGDIADLQVEGQLLAQAGQSTLA